MNNKIIDPIKSYLDWFNDLPVQQAKYIAYMFWLCTTENTADMAMSHDQALVKFKNYLLQEDFPLRVMARMVVVREVTNLIIKNRDLFTAKENFPNFHLPQEKDKVLFLSNKQWEKTLSSWQELYYSHLSEQVFTVWISSIMGKTNKD